MKVHVLTSKTIESDTEIVGISFDRKELEERMRILDLEHLTGQRRILEFDVHHKAITKALLCKADCQVIEVSERNDDRFTSVQLVGPGISMNVMGLSKESIDDLKERMGRKEHLAILVSTAPKEVSQ